MTDDELEALLADMEASLHADVTAALDLVAQDFASAVGKADALTAASFRVSRIGDMWKRRTASITTRLRSIFRRGAQTAADAVDDTVRADDTAVALNAYLAAVQPLLDAVGTRLAEAATKALADGLEAGDDTDALKARLLEVFGQEGAQLGAGRAERIAATEATRAFNAGALAAAQAMTGPDRPLVKQWLTRRDDKVREAHADTDGQLQLLDDAFDVGGTPMQYPGDPTAPAALTINCRCIMRVAAATQQEGTASMATDDSDFQSRMPPALKAYWLTGEGAAKIGWGTPGSFDRCVRNLRDDFPQDPEGLCANLYHEATGHWPGQKKGGAAAVNPDGTVHTGAMVALLPSDMDMERLALEGGEPADQLHVTMFYLGDSVDWDDDARGQVISNMANVARLIGPVQANVFGASLWNPGSDEPAYVWSVGDDRDAVGGARLADARYEVQYALEDRHGGPDLPQQHSPWVAHICAAYGKADLDAMAERVGPVTLDRLVVAFGGEWTVLPLITDQRGPYATQWEPDVEPVAVEPMELEPAPPMTWSTPGSTALAFENQQTGDGRVFAPGALYWEGSGPWPLQFAEEMMGGHDGARLAGGILGMGRDGDRIAAHGVMYQTSAGWEAASLLAQGAPLGVSVDLDDVDLEMVVADPGGQLAAELAQCQACRAMTTASAAAASTASSLTDTAPVGADAGPKTTASLSASGTGGGSTQPVTPGSSGTVDFPATPAVSAGSNWSGGKQGFAVTAAGTAEGTTTQTQSVGTTSFVPTASQPQTLSASWPNKTDAAPSAGPESSSSLTDGTPRTWTTATTPDATASSSASSATPDWDSSATTPNGWSVPPHTCASTGEVFYARLATASLLPLPDGGFRLDGTTAADVTASGQTLVSEASRMSFLVRADGRVPAAAFELSAAAGDADRPDGLVVDAQRSGEYLMRITRGRIRGATLVSIPAYADARIVLDNAAGYGLAASAGDDVTASATSDYDRVVKHVVRTSLPSTAASVARYLKISITAARRHLARAARKGDLVKLHRGTYVAPTVTDEGDADADTATASVADGLELGDSLTASASGSVDLPVADRDANWDGDAAKRRVLDWADGDCDKAGQAFAYRDDAVDDCGQANAWKLGYADVVDGTLTIIPAGAAAALAAVNGARGGTELGDDTEAVRTKLEAVRAHVNEATGGDGRDDMEASAWTAMRGMPAMPAEWFSDPTGLLEPGGPGVNYANGRIYGWVAQAGEPHAGHAKKITIDTLGNIDTTHFLRQRFILDDGTTVKAGAFTMNAGHHRDGAECETAACQFDDTRTVAGIVTVGMSDRGMWFSGAAAPWMSDWDRSVFMATQPSYHMKKGPSGNWQLRAVLSVPVPGHSSALLASAVVERSQAALTAAAMVAEVDDAIQAEQGRQDAEQAEQVTAAAPVAIDYDRLADSLVAAMARAEAKKLTEAAELEELLAEGRTMDPANHQTGRA